ncbi:MAG: hypothetical protein K0Q50_718 [Vampirovibrio sp.]|jgi:hypothetical protein|nr:hypothetical protein [Vampirovibrio sp.]
MLITKGFTRHPWWVEAETEDDMITISSTSKAPFIGTEWEKDLLLEKVTEKLRLGGYVGPLSFHVWPLAWGELRA